MNLLVTGATGFIGRALIKKILTMPEYHVSTAVRRISSDFVSEIKQHNIGEISKNTDWVTALEKIDCVIHTAARVHIMADSAKDPLEEFRRVNTMGALNLARQAAESGVKRFVYLSSIKVNGEISPAGKPFTENDNFIPKDPYALSKYEAEVGLFQLANETQMEVVIIRPPLVYGPGVKANFLKMIKWLSKKVPLPFGAIRNKRSLVALDNLVDLILICVKHPNAANQVFLVSDGDDLSTTELFKRVAKALGEKVRLVAVNQRLLEMSLRLLAKNNLALRLCGTLQVDISKAKKLLNWKPPVSVDEGLRKTAQHFLESQSK